jgi:hypothetical protein
MSTDEEPTAPPAAERSHPSKDTMFTRLEKRDQRQDERTDAAWKAALEEAKEGRRAAEKTTKLLYFLLAGALLAIVVLVAMVLDAKLNVSKHGVTVGDVSTMEVVP